MNNINRWLSGCLFVFLSILGLARGEEGLKVICASRTATPPVMDGILAEPAWKTAEVRSDFTSPGAGTVLGRRTTMRVLYDRDNLYFGFEVFWDDVSALNQGLAAIREKHPQIQAGAWQKEWQYENVCGLELFLDPGASGRNYCQMLFNAAGQCVGLYNAKLEHFTLQPEVKSALRGNCWSVELRCPAKNLQAGQEWGLNVCRNDETYYGIWKQVGGNYNNPKLFGRLVLGDYREWWETAGGTGARAQLTAMQKQRGLYADTHYDAMLNLVDQDMTALSRWAESCPPVSRDNFERLYARYASCHDQFERLRAYHETLGLLRPAR